MKAQKKVCKRPIVRFFVSCLGDVYTVSVTRKTKRMKKDVKHIYHVRSACCCFDMLARMSNNGKLENNMQLSIYPTISFRPVEEV